MKAPDFNLPDQDSVYHQLTDYKGKWVVLYFYPKDDTPGCTKEACGFRDNIKVYQDQGIVILGMSKDSVKSHQKFAEKYTLNFPLLSDESKNIIKAYGAWAKKKFMGKEFEGISRKTFLIDPTIHAQQIIEDLQRLAYVA